MLVTVTQTAPCSTGALFACVDDLARYPDWLSIAYRVDTAPALDGDPGPAWVVDLRARIGPLARSKRLRMVRVEHVEGRLVVFERKEADRRHHAGWRLRSEVQPEAAAAQLTMRLEYDGSLWGPLVDRLLRDEIDKSRPRLVAQALRNDGSTDDSPTR
jgi:hypothetical protein